MSWLAMAHSLRVSPRPPRLTALPRVLMYLVGFHDEYETAVAGRDDYETVLLPDDRPS